MQLTRPHGIRPSPTGAASGGQPFGILGTLFERAGQLIALAVRRLRGPPRSRIPSLSVKSQSPFTRGPVLTGYDAGLGTCPAPLSTGASRLSRGPRPAFLSSHRAPPPNKAMQLTGPGEAPSTLGWRLAAGFLVSLTQLLQRPGS